MFSSIFWIFRQILRFLVKITCFLSFSNKNDAESLCHFVKNLFLNPKHAKLNQNSDFGHVRTYSWLHKFKPAVRVDACRHGLHDLHMRVNASDACRHGLIFASDGVWSLPPMRVDMVCMTCICVSSGTAPLFFTSRQRFLIRKLRSSDFWLRYAWECH